jgi:glycosyltransferase involved in cell wall biosynthesis
VRLQARAVAAGVAERVIFTGPVADAPGLLAACEAFAHPAVAESFGMAIVEAMAAGLPVMSTPVGIAPEVIESGVSGVLCDDPSAAGLERALRALLELRPGWPQVGAAAASAVAGLTATAMSARYEALYRDWLSGAAPTAGACAAA